MTIQEATAKAKELNFEVFRRGCHDTPDERCEFEFKYSNYRFGTIKLKLTRQFIHSHYWKKQDEFITKVKVEEWEKGLNDYIFTIKERIIKNKIKELNKDF